jgi:hypothetical protein
MNKFDSFISRVKDVKGADELCNLICEIGLYRDNRGIYDIYEKYQVSSGGIWQNPMELAVFLWDVKDILKEAKISNFLEIGTFTGYTFFIINVFLKAHVSPDLISKTVDPDLQLDNEIYPYVIKHYQKGTIDDVKETYDLVFIDGNHSNPGPTHDFESVEKYAKFVFFHDVCDKYCPDVATAYKKYSSEYEGNIYSLSKTGCFGIGFLKLK